MAVLALYDKIYKGKRQKHSYSFWFLIFFVCLLCNGVHRKTRINMLVVVAQDDQWKDRNISWDKVQFCSSFLLNDIFYFYVFCASQLCVFLWLWRSLCAWLQFMRAFANPPLLSQKDLSTITSAGLVLCICSKDPCMHVKIYECPAHIYLIIHYTFLSSVYVWMSFSRLLRHVQKLWPCSQLVSFTPISLALIQSQMQIGNMPLTAKVKVVILPSSPVMDNSCTTESIRRL